jgi:hypothetical protein
MKKHSVFTAAFLRGIFTRLPAGSPPANPHEYDCPETSVSRPNSLKNAASPSPSRAKNRQAGRETPEEPKNNRFFVVSIISGSSWIRIFFVSRDPR